MNCRCQRSVLWAGIFCMVALRILLDSDLDFAKIYGDWECRRDWAANKSRTFPAGVKCWRWCQRLYEFFCSKVQSPESRILILLMQPVECRRLVCSFAATSAVYATPQHKLSQTVPRETGLVRPCMNPCILGSYSVFLPLVG